MSDAKMASDEVAETKLVEFTHFPKLPLEIQLEIWKYAVPGPRVIKVKVFAPQSIYDPHHRLPRRMTISSRAIQGLVLSTKTKSPGFLFACQVSRAAGLKHYTACLKLGSGKETRFDPGNDIIFLSQATKYYLQPLPGRLRGIEDRINFVDTFSGVRKLAVSAHDLAVSISKPGSLWMISRFQSLKSLFVIMNDLHHRTSLLDPRAKSDEQLRLYTLDELGPDTWEKVRNVGQVGEEFCAIKLRDWKARATYNGGAKKYIMDWENLQVKPTILVTSSVRP